MINKKKIAIIAFAAALLSANISVWADSSNDLLKMDVKRSSASDTVDVTFYTTGNPSNSVVTRKDNNRYVVLLPNTSSTSSIAPNIAGIKDLLTDVSVKNVNDGLGGYTKVTFSTTKPIKIQTYTKKTAPLTQAQQDYKNLIAKNSKYDPDKKLENFKKVSNQNTAQNNKSTTQTQTPKVNSQKTTQSPAPAKSSQPAQKTQTAKNPIAAISVAAASIKIPQAASKMTNQKSQSDVVKKENFVQKPVTVPEKSTKDVSTVSYVPDKEIKIETEQTLMPDNNVKNEAQTDKNMLAAASSGAENIAKKGKATESKYTKILHVGLWVLLAMLLLLIGRRRSVKPTRISKNTISSSVVETNSQNQSSKEEYEQIIHDNKMNWQQKFKRYNETKTEEKSSNLSFVTNMSASKSALVEQNTESVKPEKNTKVTPKIKNVPVFPALNRNRKRSAKENLQAKISQMEHVLANTPSMKEEIVPSNKKVMSEDIVITDAMEHVKLRSFAKDRTLNRTSRHILKNDEKIEKPLTEGKFVKLKNSPLSVNHRSSGAMRYGLNIEQLQKSNIKNLMNNGVKGMEELNENYSQASLDEYLAILDRENAISGVENTNTANRTMANMSNPIASTYKSKDNYQQTTAINGLTVQSGYDIDKDRGFYLVKMDGISALVGKVDDEIFVLKKFDKVINHSLQVRLDYGSVYIVKAGEFKCLVDVSENKMGTLLEI